MNTTLPPVTTVLAQGPGSDVLELSARYLEEYRAKIDHCLASLDEERLWWRPNAASNSIGNLVLHLTGNLSQWVLQQLGGESFVRQRSAEFSAHGGHSAAELGARLEQVVGRCRRVITALTPADLAAEKEVQGYVVDGLGIVYHAVEHMSYHTGQIVAFAKLLETADGIDFYPRHGSE